MYVVICWKPLIKRAFKYYYTTIAFFLGFKGNCSNFGKFQETMTYRVSKEDPYYFFPQAPLYERHYTATINVISRSVQFTRNLYLIEA
jgi:hypothetical protein